MKLAKIPDAAITSLLRSLGLLIGQAGIYGVANNVTQIAARAAFPMLEQAVGKHGAIEITLRDRALLINGEASTAGSASGRNLVERMVLHKVEGVAFLPPANWDEFLKFVTLFGTSPMDLAAAGGFENVMKRANLRSVQVVNVQYRRVTGSLAAKPDPDRPAKPRAPRRTGTRILADMLGLDALPEKNGADADALCATTSPGQTEETRQETIAARRQRSVALAAMLRQAAALLEQHEDSAIEDRYVDMVAAFNPIRDLLASLSTDAERGIRALAGQVNADRKTIASIESAARRNGIGLQLTREDLVTRYAEISQEITQPLTVSSGVIEMLHSGRAGDLTASQRELLKMATESVERVNTLVNHLKLISGMPDTLTPHAQILKDAYRGPSTT
ncbi:MAG: histidine kinase dimerization/phospho-acceptor domain-containing protein [bacterium]